MLPDIGWTEMLVIAIVLIVVVGPKDLPKVLRGFGRTMTNVRKMAGDFRKQFDEALSEAELDDVRKLASDARAFDPRRQLRDALNPLGEIGRDLNNDIRKSIGDLDAPAPAKSAAATALDESGAKARAAQEALMTPRAKIAPGPQMEPLESAKPTVGAALPVMADKPQKTEKPAKADKPAKAAATAKVEKPAKPKAAAAPAPKAKLAARAAEPTTASKPAPKAAKAPKKTSKA